MVSDGTELAVQTAISDGHWHTIGGLAWGLNEPRRAVEEAIESLRLQGEPIVAGNDGVKLTRDAGELATYLEGRRRRAAQIHRGTMAMRTTLRTMQAPTLTLWSAA